MTTTTNPDNDPCTCHLVEYTSTDTLCPACEEARQRRIEVRLAKGSSEEEPEYLDTPGSDDYFTDAASRMSRDDWDADNDWLASAGWGEM